MMFHRMMDCGAWKSLSTPARAVYLQIARRYNGSNNGSIGYSVRRAADECNINKDTASRALNELAEKGFIERTKAGSFTNKRVAAEWRLTWFSCDLTKTPASKLCLQWRGDGVFDTAPEEAAQSDPRLCGLEAR
jgi:DNA-binding transcriptional MocR family regulator